MVNDSIRGVIIDHKSPATTREAALMFMFVTWFTLVFACAFRPVTIAQFLYLPDWEILRMSSYQ